MVEIELIAAPPFALAGAPENANCAVTWAGHRSIASLAVFEGCLAPLQDALGFVLPSPGLQARDGDVAYLWAGPGNWLAVASMPDLDTRLIERCNKLAAVTDQSDGRSILCVAGPGARDALAKLLPIDLHPSVFPADATAMTLAGHIPVQIWHGENGFELACFRSFAETLVEALVQACG